MGRLINLKCEKCGYETNLGIGAGMTFNDIENVITFFDKETQEKIRELLANNKDLYWSVTKEIGVCEKCGKISAIAVFRVSAGGKDIEYRAKCQCGSSSVEIKDYDKIAEGTQSINCPICGDKLTVTYQGHWD